MRVITLTGGVIRGVDGRAQGVEWRSPNDFIAHQAFC